MALGTVNGSYEEPKGMTGVKRIISNDKERKK